ncbi:ABC transporter permease [Rhodanobacter sp. DHG33]|uniref:ABC transporter permease n=1 Tax=Rhodanobacter sp. DHG33 TaxID=2775921 RepID=UPI0017805A2C|nr:ABC transporter permease [Rhodanobacter sp. DHG33]MBD8897757.1 ABC transporter permease [Rhodanobacter sp. DHG33]
MSNASANLVALNTVTRREIVRILRIWTQTLIPPVITVTLYYVIFGKLVGSRIGSIDGGFSYMEYIVPGLVMMNIITSSYANISSSFFGAKFQRSVEEMLVSPMPHWIMLLGYVLGAMTRGLIVGALVLLVALFFTHLHLIHPLMVLLSVLLGSAIFSLTGFINAIYARKFDDVALVPTFVLTPLTYLGGVFYSVKMLPEPWQSISRANPILYMVNAFRYGVLGISDVQVGVAIVVMIGFVLMLTAFALYLLKRGVGLRS